MSALGTFFGWRGARQGKLGVRAAQQTTAAVAQGNAAERRRELIAQGLVGFNATDREVREVEARLALERRHRDLAYRQQHRAQHGHLVLAFGTWFRAQQARTTPLPMWAFWTLAVLDVVFGVTLVGLPVSAFITLLLCVRHPWRADTDRGIPELDPATMPIAVPHGLPMAAGRHAR